MNHNALEDQIGGKHYKDQTIQPILLAYLVAGGDAVFCKVAKYLSRDKGNKLENLHKALHCTQLGFLSKGVTQGLAELPEAYKELIRVFVKDYDGTEEHVSLLVKVAEHNYRAAEQVAKLILAHYNEEEMKHKRAAQYAAALTVAPHRIWYDFPIDILKGD